MKLFNFICILAFLSIASVYAADPIIKPQRFSDDSKIIGYALMKEPSNFYAKFIKLANLIYPGSGAGIDQQVAMVKPILDSSVSIAVILYSNETFEQNPFVGVYITVKDKKVFDNPMINMMPTHEIVDNTLVISTDPKGLEKFKSFQKNVIALKGQKDIEAFIDIKNIITLNENAITDNTPYAKDIFSQVEMATVKLDLADAGIEYSGSIISKDKTNLQTLLTQPGVDSTSLLKYTGAGNLVLGVANYDLSKAKGFLQDLIKMSYLVPEISESEKKLIKEFEPILLDFCNSELISTASTMSFNDTLKSKYILKMKDPALFINRIKAVYTKLNSAGLKEVLTKIELKDKINFDWAEVEKYNGIQIYKLGSNAKKPEEVKNLGDNASPFEIMANMGSMPTDQFLAADQTYCYSATDIASLKEIIESVKSNPKAEVPLESFNFFKAGSTTYMDIQLIGYFKLIEKMVKPLVGINLDSLLNLKLPPLKAVVKLDGNLNAKTFIETATITTLVQKGIEMYTQSMQSAPQNMDGGDDNQKSQP